jgi:hypothetical protein
MFNPCKKCVVKGNCTTECSKYRLYQTRTAIVCIYLTAFIIGLISVFLVIFDFPYMFPFWLVSIILCHIIPKISTSIEFIDSIILGPFIVLIFILATILKPIVMRPVEYHKLKKRTFFEKFFNS